MTNLLKSITFLVAFSCILFSCDTPTESNSSKASMETPQSTTIQGMVQTIQFGKDGYTSNVETKEDGVYAALVSIVNVGGPENYQQFNIGDRVTLEGTTSVLNGTKQLKVEKIINVAPSRTQLSITSTSFRGISTGDIITDHSDYITKEQMQTGEGTFDIYRIKDFNNNPAGYLMADPNDKAVVGDITVETQMAQTAEAIKVGSSFQQLRSAIPTIEVHGSEVEGRTYATANNISYRLDAANFTYEVDMEKIPGATKITQIVINRGYVDVNGLNNKYSKISKDEYCWLVNKKMDVYTTPMDKNTIQGPHFKGEVLQVLDSKVIDNQLWVNVTFSLKVKTGYEDQFADGQVMSKGSPSGWIGGTEAPLINCK